MLKVVGLFYVCFEFFVVIGDRRLFIIFIYLGLVGKWVQILKVEEIQGLIRFCLCLTQDVNYNDRILCDWNGVRVVLLWVVDGVLDIMNV